LQPRVLVWLAVLSCFPALRADPGPRPVPGQAILQRYLAATNGQRTALRDVSMEVDIEATLPKLKKTGKLHALRHISRLGKVTYEVLSFIGDNMIKKDVIARYIAAEVESSDAGNRRSMAIDEENYKFRYRGMYGEGDWRLHLFELRPRKKRLGLFSGWLWIEATTALPVRESGRLVKNPSVFLKRVEFLRDYEMRDGVAVPVRVESSIHTRLVGVAELNIRFGEVSSPEERAMLSDQDVLGSR